MRTYVMDLLVQWGVADHLIDTMIVVLAIFFILIVSIIANFLTKKILLRMLCHFIKKNKFKWDNILMEHKFFDRLANIVPALIISAFAEWFPAYTDTIQRMIQIVLIILFILIFNAFLNGVDAIYRNYEVSKARPIKGFLQVGKIVVYAIGTIVILSSLIGQNPLIILSGLGAMTAVLIIVFQDSLLGFVAGILISTNDMVRIGDWIEMPKYGADGDVIDISLHTIKIENFDRTITTIPSYALVSDSFKNWRGMVETGGRRIKRSIYIDISSIKFCSPDMLDQFKKIHYLSEYIDFKTKEIDEYNQKHQIDVSQIVNGRRITNIGTFREYVKNYLKNHHKVHQGMIQMVRQLPPGEHGIPIEIYVFTNDIQWVNFEAIQADIFDHIISVTPHFGLRIFQEPSGYDFREAFKNQP